MMAVAQPNGGGGGSASATPTQSLGLQHDPQAPTSTVQLITKIPKILPHERVFPIQIGSELFKLSGASISSDGRPMIYPSFLPRQRGLLILP